METFQNKTEFMQALRDELAKRNISDTRDILLDFEQHFADGISSGLTEKEVCSKLGDLNEIVTQYQDEAAEMNTCRSVEPIAAPVFTTADTSSTQSAANTASDTATANAEASGFGSNDYSGAQGAGAAANPSGGNTNTAQNNAAANNTASSASNSGKQEQFNIGGLIGALCVDVFVFSWAIPSLASVICAFFALPIAFGVTGLTSFICGIFSGLTSLLSFVSPFGPMTNIMFGIMLMALAGLGVLLSISMVKGFVNVIINIINWHARLIVGKNVVSNIGKKPNKA